jgi:predicted nucleic acid-binding protein
LVEGSLAPAVITLDTSALYELPNGKSPDYQAVRDALLADRGPFIVPASILAEIAYMIETRLGSAVLDAFLGDLDSGAFSLDCTVSDLPYVRHLLNRYADLELGFSDASVIACAERNGGNVLTLDRRDFGVVAHEGRISLFPW